MATSSGQTIYDRITAARYALAGQGLARCVCKATTEEVIGPKKKHLDYLLACTHEPNVSIPQLANLLIERTNHIYWVVVFKALVTVHHLMSYGNERFTQYLASSNYSFELSTFLDKTTARDFSMSTFIRRYSRYINEKALSYRLLAFDFCKIKRGNEGILRLMPIDRLLKTLPILQNQLDALLEFDCSANDLNNGVINASFMLLFRDLIGLFACHNDGIINLLNKYFNLNRKMCREAFDLYKKFLVRMDKVSDFLRVAEVVGIDKDEIPDLKRAPNSLIEALEQHLLSIESSTSSSSNKNKILKDSKAGKQSTSNDFSSAFGNLTPPTSRRPNSPGNFAQVAAVLSSTASSATNNSQTDPEFSINNFKDEEVRKALEEEARVLSQYGTFDGKSTPSRSDKSSKPVKEQSEGSPKFAVNTIPKSIDDVFGDTDSFGAANVATSTVFPDNGLNFDNLSSASSNGSTQQQQQQQQQSRHRPDVDSIKSAIRMATSTLEGGKSNSRQPTTAKKASDDLFGLLDGNPASQPATTQEPAPSKDPISPFSTSSNSPFTVANQQQSTLANGHLPFKARGNNPFPEVTSCNDVFQTTSNSSASAAAVTAAAFTPFPLIAPLAPSVPAHQGGLTNNSNGGPSVIGNSSQTETNKSQVKATANYTNLGGLEGFGELLQPSGLSNKPLNNNNNGPTLSSTNNLKSAFNSTSGVGAGAGHSNAGLFKGDLDSTLANLAQNLTFEGIKGKK